MRNRRRGGGGRKVLLYKTVLDLRGPKLGKLGIVISRPR